MFDYFVLVSIFAFVLVIIKMCMNHNERIEKIKRGYPLDDKKPEMPMESPGYVDYTKRQQ